MTYTPKQIVEAVVTVLKGSVETHSEPAPGEVPSAAAAALAKLGLPQDDAKALGPRRVFAPGEVEHVLGELEASLARDKVTADVARSALGFLGLV